MPPVGCGVVRARQAHRFNCAGSTRSYWDFYYGYGLMAATTVFVEAMLFWLLASLARARGSAASPIVALFLLANLVHATLAWRYFFATPIVPDLLIAICLVGAFVARAALASIYKVYLMRACAPSARRCLGVEHTRADAVAGCTSSDGIARSRVHSIQN